MVAFESSHAKLDSNHRPSKQWEVIVLRGDKKDIYIYVYIYIGLYIYTANIYDNMTCEQSRKLQVHGKDIHKFGKAPSLATCLHKMMYMANVWQTCGVSLKGRQNVCGPLFSKLRRGLLAAIAANGNVSICTLW